MGLVGSERPRMFSVQAEGCAPIVRAFESGGRFAEPWQGAATSAGGLRVPAAVGDFLILDAIRASGGAALAVPESELAPTQALLGRLGCGYLSLETAAAVAALPVLLESGRIARNDTVVVFDTGAGFKSEAVTAGLPRPLPNDPAAWDATIEALRR
jgi:threonine synthase